MTNNDYERLKRTLLENGETEDKAEALAQMAYFLRKLPAPKTSAEQQANLLNRLAAELPRRKTRWERLREWYPLLLLFSQLRTIHREIWAASALILILGTFVTLAQPAGSGMLALVALAPVVAAAGVAMLYDGSVELMLELEEATLASARLLLLARLTLIFGFDLLLASAGSIALALTRTELSLMPLILSWLAPMAFLSALAFLLSVLLVDTLAAALFSLALWFAHIMLRHAENLPELFTYLSMPGLSASETRPLLFVAAVFIVAVALWLVGLIERKTGGTA